MFISSSTFYTLLLAKSIMISYNKCAMSNILLVEDDRTFSKILETFLVRQGFEVEVKHDLNTGLQKLRERKFDLLLLDYRLPDGTGLDFLAKCDEDCSSFPTIMMTSF